MIETRLNGLFPPGFQTPERVNLSELIRKAGGRPQTPNPPVRIDDARPLQAAARSDAEFFDEHGFVLLGAPTAVTDWDDADEIGRIYLPEVETLIRKRLYPGRRIEVIQPPNVGRRGRDTAMPQYGIGVHQDHGTTADDFEHNVLAFTSPEIASRWRARFEREDVEGYVNLDFWRTTNMNGPLEHMPLALCDPGSIDPADILPTALEGIAPSGMETYHVSLRYNADQRWYYYPRMKGDEVLVFKLFELMREVDPQPYRACFHTAVEDPSAPADAQPRQSSEHRVSVLLLKD